MHRLPMRTTHHIPHRPLPVGLGAANTTGTPIPHGAARTTATRSATHDECNTCEEHKKRDEDTPTQHCPKQVTGVRRVHDRKGLMGGGVGVGESGPRAPVADREMRRVASPAGGAHVCVGAELYPFPHPLCSRAWVLDYGPGFPLCASFLGVTKVCVSGPRPPPERPPPPPFPGGGHLPLYALVQHPQPPLFIETPSRLFWGRRGCPGAALSQPPHPVRSCRRAGHSTNPQGRWSQTGGTPVRRCGGAPQAQSVGAVGMAYPLSRPAMHRKGAG